MGVLTRFKEAEQLPFDWAEAEGVQVGDLVAHVDHRDFRGRVVGREDGRCEVKVLAGWHGPFLPTWAVGMPARKLEVVYD